MDWLSHVRVWVTILCGFEQYSLSNTYVPWVLVKHQIKKKIIRPGTWPNGSICLACAVQDPGLILHLWLGMECRGCGEDGEVVNSNKVHDDKMWIVLTKKWRTNYAFYIPLTSIFLFILHIDNFEIVCLGIHRLTVAMNCNKNQKSGLITNMFSFSYFKKIELDRPRPPWGARFLLLFPWSPLSG